MTEKFIGEIADFFYLKQSFGCLISFILEENENIKIGDKIKLITPENETVETYIREIPMINRRNQEGKVPDYRLISVGIENTERNKKGFQKGTKIYWLSKNYE